MLYKIYEGSGKLAKKGPEFLWLQIEGGALQRSFIQNNKQVSFCTEFFEIFFLRKVFFFLSEFFWSESEKQIQTVKWKSRKLFSFCRK